MSFRGRGGGGGGFRGGRGGDRGGGRGGFRGGRGGGGFRVSIIQKKLEESIACSMKKCEAKG